MAYLPNPVGLVCAHDINSKTDGAVNRGKTDRFNHYGFRKKTFDKAEHRKLLHKLDYYGVRGSTH